MTIRQKMTSRVAMAVLGLLVVGAAGYSLKGDERAAVQESGQYDVAARVLPVQVQTIKRVNHYSQARSYSGLIAAHRTSQVGFERAGRVLSVLVDEGGQVSVGQPIARVDHRHLSTRRMELQSRKTQAEAILAELESGPRKQTIAAARKDLVDLVARKDLAERNRQRDLRLMNNGATTKARMDASTMALESAVAQVSAAQERLKELEIGSRLEQVAAQRAVVMQLDASLKDLDLDVEDCTLRSPYAGQISKRMIDEGAFVSPGQAIVEVMETGRLEARIGIPDANAHQLAGQAFEITVGQHSLEAKFDRAQPSVDLQTRTQLIVFSLPANAINSVLPGQVARIRIQQETATDGYWVPTTSLVQGARGLWATYIATEQDSDRAKVERRVVEVLYTEGASSLVRGTLNDGEQIVVSGTQRIVPGQLVKPITSIK